MPQPPPPSPSSSSAATTEFRPRRRLPLDPFSALDTTTASKHDNDREHENREHTNEADREHEDTPWDVPAALLRTLPALSLIRPGNVILILGDPSSRDLAALLTAPALANDLLIFAAHRPLDVPAPLAARTRPTVYVVPLTSSSASPSHSHSSPSRPTTPTNTGTSISVHSPDPISALHLVSILERTAVLARAWRRNPSHHLTAAHAAPSARSRLRQIAGFPAANHHFQSQSNHHLTASDAGSAHQVPPAPIVHFAEKGGVKGAELVPVPLSSGTSDSGPTSRSAKRSSFFMRLPFTNASHSPAHSSFPAVSFASASTKILASSSSASSSAPGLPLGLTRTQTSASSSAHATHGNSGGGGGNGSASGSTSPGKRPGTSSSMLFARARRGSAGSLQMPGPRMRMRAGSTSEMRSAGTRWDAGDEAGALGGGMGSVMVDTTDVAHRPFDVLLSFLPRYVFAAGPGSGSPERPLAKASHRQQFTPHSKRGSPPPPLPALPSSLSTSHYPLSSSPLSPSPLSSSSSSPTSSSSSSPASSRRTSGVSVPIQVQVQLADKHILKHAILVSTIAAPFLVDAPGAYARGGGGVFNASTSWGGGDGCEDGEGGFVIVGRRRSSSNGSRVVGVSPVASLSTPALNAGPSEGTETRENGSGSGSRSGNGKTGKGPSMRKRASALLGRGARRASNSGSGVSSAHFAPPPPTSSSPSSPKPKAAFHFSSATSGAGLTMTTARRLPPRIVHVLPPDADGVSASVSSLGNGRWKGKERAASVEPSRLAQGLEGFLLSYSYGVGSSTPRSPAISFAPTTYTSPSRPAQYAPARTVSSSALDGMRAVPVAATPHARIMGRPIPFVLPAGALGGVLLGFDAPPATEEGQSQPDEDDEERLTVLDALLGGALDAQACGVPDVTDGEGPAPEGGQKRRAWLAGVAAVHVLEDEDEDEGYFEDVDVEEIRRELGVRVDAANRADKGKGKDKGKGRAADEATSVPVKDDYELTVQPQPQLQRSQQERRARRRTLEDAPAPTIAAQLAHPHARNQARYLPHPHPHQPRHPHTKKPPAHDLVHETSVSSPEVSPMSSAGSTPPMTALAMPAALKGYVNAGGKGKKDRLLPAPAPESSPEIAAYRASAPALTPVPVQGALPKRSPSPLMSMLASKDKSVNKDKKDSGKPSTLPTTSKSSKSSTPPPPPKPSKPSAPSKLTSASAPTLPRAVDSAPLTRVRTSFVPLPMLDIASPLSMSGDAAPATKVTESKSIDAEIKTKSTKPEYLQPPSPMYVSRTAVVVPASTAASAGSATAGSGHKDGAPLGMSLSLPAFPSLTLNIQNQASRSSPSSDSPAQSRQRAAPSPSLSSSTSTSSPTPPSSALSTPTSTSGMIPPASASMSALPSKQTQKPYAFLDSSPELPSCAPPKTAHAQGREKDTTGANAKDNVKATVENGNKKMKFVPLAMPSVPSPTLSFTLPTLNLGALFNTTAAQSKKAVVEPPPSPLTPLTPPPPVIPVLSSAVDPSKPVTKVTVTQAEKEAEERARAEAQEKLKKSGLLGLLDLGPGPSLGLGLGLGSGATATQASMSSHGSSDVEVMLISDGERGSQENAQGRDRATGDVGEVRLEYARRSERGDDERRTHHGHEDRERRRHSRDRERDDNDKGREKEKEKDKDRHRHRHHHRHESRDRHRHDRDDDGGKDKDKDKEREKRSRRDSERARERDEYALDRDRDAADRKDKDKEKERERERRREKQEKRDRRERERQIREKDREYWSALEREREKEKEKERSAGEKEPHPRLERTRSYRRHRSADRERSHREPDRDRSRDRDRDDRLHREKSDRRERRHRQRSDAGAGAHDVVPVYDAKTQTWNAAPKAAETKLPPASSSTTTSSKAIPARPTDKSSSGAGLDTDLDLRLGLGLGLGLSAGTPLHLHLHPHGLPTSPDSGDSASVSMASCDERGYVREGKDRKETSKKEKEKKEKKEREGGWKRWSALPIRLSRVPA